MLIVLTYIALIKNLIYGWQDGKFDVIAFFILTIIFSEGVDDAARSSLCIEAKK